PRTICDRPATLPGGSPHPGADSMAALGVHAPRPGRLPRASAFGWFGSAAWSHPAAAPPRLACAYHPAPLASPSGHPVPVGSWRSGLRILSSKCPSLTARAKEDISTLLRPDISISV